MGGAGAKKSAVEYGSPETVAASIIARHGLLSLHLFVRGEGWRVFGSRGDSKFQQSVEEGGGETIIIALLNLNARLDAGPIRANEIAPLPRIKATGEAT